jgi:hypothetical protein
LTTGDKQHQRTISGISSRSGRRSRAVSGN